MFEQIRANQRRTIILVVAMACLMLLLGYVLGEALAPGAGTFGLLMAFVFWVFLALISYFSGDQIFLTLSSARKIEKQDHPVLFNVVEEMCIASGVSRVPDIYIIDDAAPNAFATGRDPQHASVAVTSGLLQLMSRDELQGVIAHELGHVRNRDILYIMMVGVMLGSIVMIAEMGGRMFRFGSYTRTSPRRSSKGSGQAQLIFLVLAIALIILAPIIAQLLYFAVSRRREYLADATSAEFTRYPEGLANALEKLSQTTTKLRTASDVTAAMYIVNPLKVTSNGLADLTSTHPPISERIRILRSMGTDGTLAQYDNAFRQVTGRAVGLVPLGRETSTGSRVAPPRSTPAIALPGLGGGTRSTSPANEALSTVASIAAAATAAAADTPIERTRQTTDMLWKLNDYVFIACPCQTNLKVPPSFRGRSIVCPHCQRVHQVQS